VSEKQPLESGMTTCSGELDAAKAQTVE
jgi:hypothetical protein